MPRSVWRRWLAVSPWLLFGLCAGIWLLVFSVGVGWRQAGFEGLFEHVPQQTTDPLPGSRLSGVVSKVVDGDSLEMMVAGKLLRVRLYGIDAPEWEQPWGRRSRNALARLVYRERVDLEVVDTDRYGRQIAIVKLGGRNINREMVQTGDAWVYRRYIDDRSLEALEAQARAAQLGLWRRAEPVPPWEWRESKR